MWTIDNDNNTMPPYTPEDNAATTTTMVDASAVDASAVDALASLKTDGAKGTPAAAKCTRMGIRSLPTRAAKNVKKPDTKEEPDKKQVSSSGKLAASGNKRAAETTAKKSNKKAAKTTAKKDKKTAKEEGDEGAPTAKDKDTRPTEVHVDRKMKKKMKREKRRNKRIAEGNMASNPAANVLLSKTEKDIAFYKYLLGSACSKDIMAWLKKCNEMSVLDEETLGYCRWARYASDGRAKNWRPAAINILLGGRFDDSLPKDNGDWDSVKAQMDAAKHVKGLIALSNDQVDGKDPFDV